MYWRNCNTKVNLIFLPDFVFLFASVQLAEPLDSLCSVIGKEHISMRIRARSFKDLLPKCTRDTVFIWRNSLLIKRWSFTAVVVWSTSRGYLYDQMDWEHNIKSLPALTTCERCLLDYWTKWRQRWGCDKVQRNIRWHTSALLKEDSSSILLNFGLIGAQTAQPKSGSFERWFVVVSGHSFTVLNPYVK